MHTQSSVLYRRERITTHTRQLRATVMVRVYLGSRYGLTSLRRHERALIGALKHMEWGFHA